MTMFAVTRRAVLAGTALATAALVGWPGGGAAAEEVLKVGVLGVMSGPAASWGLTNKYCAEATANMYNAKGGVDIGGEKYKIEIVAVDDKNDPKLTVSGAERLTQQEGIKYIIGPNVDTTAASVRPIAENNGAIYFP
jgi:branched-chain amino acid transport system substrate-binding protein